MRQKSILLFIFFLITGCFLSIFFLFQSDSKNTNCHFVKIPVSFFPFSDSPLIKLTILKKEYTLLIDTGSSHTLDLHKRVLEKIQEKEFLKITQYSDLQGICYPVSQYRVPEITLYHHLHLNGIIAHEENMDFLTKGTNARKASSFLGKIKKQLSLLLIDGRIGWPSFKETFCFFDFHHNLLILAKDQQTLQNEGIFILENFIQIPLELSRCGPMLSVQTELGMKKFLLDTGASYSVYKEADLSSENILEYSLSIKDHNFGKWKFFPYPIGSNLLQELDGILGIDFFKTHVICFDFQEGYIYIQENQF